MTETEAKWPALTRLRGMRMAERREFLRLHEESGFGADDLAAIKLREQLDRELGLITGRELLNQVKGVAARARPDIPHFDWLLRSSPPFIQYLNFYLYCGVRFAAGRIFPPCEPRPIAGSDCNEPLAALPSPPICLEGWKNGGAMAQFLLKVRRDYAPQRQPSACVHGAAKGASIPRRLHRRMPEK